MICEYIGIFNFHVRLKTKLSGILILLIIINPSYFQLNALKPGVYGFLWSASISALFVFMCNRKRGYFIIFNKSFFMVRTTTGEPGNLIPLLENPGIHMTHPGNP